MMHKLALAWAALVVLSGGYLLVRMHAGLPLRTDLLALLPREDRDPVLQRANEIVTRNLSRRIVVLVGHRERATARAAAARLKVDLTATGMLPAEDAFSSERLKRIGQLYFPYRHGLLAEADRVALQAGRSDEVADRGLAQVFGVGGIVDARLLQSDPFLLLPAFLANLPVPLSKLAPDDGMPTVVDRETTWAAVLGVLAGEPFAFDVQKRLATALNRSAAELKAEFPGLQVKRLGAVFFANEGSRRALAEATVLSTVSIIGSITLIILVFRRAVLLIANVLVVVVGIGMGLAASLALFGELHVAALLFGTSLIGMAVDYGLFYSTSIFNPAGETPTQRLRLTLPGMTLGLITTGLGYGALYVAPFPGLRQIAVFSVIGLVAAFLTVVLWLPLLDRSRPDQSGHRLLTAADRVLKFWEEDRVRLIRTVIITLAAVVTVVGLSMLRTDDDVRRLQALAHELLREEEEIRGLIGVTAATQYLLVEAEDDETALRRQEALLPVLAKLVKDGVITSAQAPAAFVPSAARQRENGALLRAALEDTHVARIRESLGLGPPETVSWQSDAGLLTLSIAVGSDSVPFLRELVLGPGLHVVALQGLARPDAVRAAIVGMPGVRFVDPTEDFSTLLGKYRARAMLLTGLSALVMYFGLICRYGVGGGTWVILPAAVAVTLAPASLALAGQAYTFFHAMAQVILLAIGTDYAIFCAEARGDGISATLLAVWLAAITSLLSFGLLAFSSVPAVHNFGCTMLIGITLSVAVAPLANRARRSQIMGSVRAATN
jgi:predicted exporter